MIKALELLKRLRRARPAPEPAYERHPHDIEARLRLAIRSVGTRPHRLLRNPDGSACTVLRDRPRFAGLPIRAANA